MTRALIVHRAGPGVTVQDPGRPGYLAYGLSRGGAADRLALAEGAALLGQSDALAVLEMAGIGGEFEVTEATRIALTGAPMRASVDGTRIAWNACHRLEAGARLSIGAAGTGNYGYLHLGGGVALPRRLGGCGTHLSAGLGAPLKAADRLEIRPDTGSRTGMAVAADDRFGGGTVRIVASLQTDLFAAGERARFEATTFRRDARGNRMGVRLDPDGPGFESEAGLSVLSEVIVPGDIQITGDGTPFVLLNECQTIGGYPRIGSVLPADLPKVVQARAGETLRFSFVSLEEAVAIEARARDARKSLRKRLTPLIRDPATIADLLSYQLVSGVTAGDDLERSER
ncbi:biotin-dependent carboxyltransferase family protein [Pseudaestuariivita atlantica]|uniref:Urea amidolyase n=1 Tax=Pseudaestuariivita atlantica TaxID=1317121 RepID=A0A0L1JM44_9RHOB|nr:biotin-dependent carboxyltransferase family protein [Pseudaestuariivita atlantica]KNG92829.1 urea amidolyase [Pseudaestuariivita atlantica]